MIPQLETSLDQIREYIRINEEFVKSIETNTSKSLGDRVLLQLHNRISVNLKVTKQIWDENKLNPAIKFSTGLLLRTICTDIITFKYLAVKEDENLLKKELKLLHREYLMTTLSFIKDAISLFKGVVQDDYLTEFEIEKNNIIKNENDFFDENGEFKKVKYFSSDLSRGNFISENYKMKYIRKREPNIIRNQFPLSRSLYYFNKFHHYSLASQELAKDDDKYFDSFYWIIFESVTILRLTILRFYEEKHPLVLRILELENVIKQDFVN